MKIQVPGIVDELMVTTINGLILGIASTIIVYGIIKGLMYLFALFRNRPIFSFSGYWIGKYEAVFTENNSAVDILHMKMQKGKIIVKFQQYCNMTSSHRTWHGEGYIAGNGSRMAIAYFFANRVSYQNGVMLLTQTDVGATKKALSGIFYEIHDRVNSGKDRDGSHERSISIYGTSLKSCSAGYAACRLKLSTREKLLFRLNKPVFKSHEHANLMFEECK